MNYTRTVSAALSETQSKFKLAEALALDIPHRRSGISDDDTVMTYLARARQAIIDAGGEPRELNTLKQYRCTALWVSTPQGTFRWVPGTSFTAHREAKSYGMPFADFAAKPMNVDQLRREFGKAGTDGKPSDILNRWSEEDLDDVLDKPENRRKIRRALDDHDKKVNKPRPLSKPGNTNACTILVGQIEKLTDRLEHETREIQGVSFTSDQKEFISHSLDDLETAIAVLREQSLGQPVNDWDIAELVGR